MDTLYVLDEPSIGLHPRDNERLIAILLQLRDQGNTVIVVEHDADMIRVADQVVDMGLGAGEQGGRVIYSGLGRRAAEGSAVADGALSARRAGDSGAGHAPPAGRRSACAFSAPTEHNLKDVDVEIPLGVMTCVTGVSGSGKSTLVHDVIYAAIKRVKGDWDRRVGAHRAARGRRVRHRRGDGRSAADRPDAAVESRSRTSRRSIRFASCSRRPRTRSRAD